MTDDRSLERAARSWIESGPTRAPERAVKAALSRIEATSQERGLRVPWRFTMTTPARFAAAAVIGVLAIGGAIFLIGNANQPNVGGPVVSALPSSLPTSSAPASIAEATPPSSAPLPAGPMVAGTYVATPFAAGKMSFCMLPPQPGCSESDDDSISFTFTVPDGWAGINDAVWLDAEQSSAPAGATLGFGRGGWLHSDPCVTRAQDVEDGAPPDIAVGPSVDEFASAIADHPLLEATDPVPVTLGGYSGKYVDLQLPADLAGCEASYFPWEPGIYAQGPGHRWHVWILDVDGVRVLVHTTDYAGTSDQDRRELQSMIDSIQIEP